MAGCWQTPAVSLPVRLRRPAWRTTAARALPAELMASLSLIPQLITSARSSLMKESPHRDEKRRGGGRERFGRERECEKVKEKERVHCGNKKTDWEGTEGEGTNREAEHQSEEEEKTKRYVRENEEREAPGSRWENSQFENVCDLSVVISLGESCPCSAAL